MPRGSSSRLRNLFRFVAFLLAIALGVLAVWLIAMGKSDKQHQLGIIAGLWSGLIGAFGLYWLQSPGRGEVVAATNTASAPESATGLEVRQQAALDTQREVASRRAFEQQLHALVRREMEHMQTAMSEQMAQLRAEVATLRGDLLEKVGGQIRLERIETTRVIGSDIEALQHEVRQLAIARGLVLPGAELHRFDPAVDLGVAPAAVAPLVPVLPPTAPAAPIQPPQPVQPPPAQPPQPPQSVQATSPPAP
ncbi:MAG: hypothetical protein JO147_07120, partial [Actinobacteria bacterium]|nr:hypothetical protein [Actinomycetota bacterium]